MDEFKFVAKSLLATVIILFALQLRVSNRTLESQLLDFIQTSAVTAKLQEVAAGGALAVRNAAKSVGKFAENAFEPGQNEARASRLNINFSRSPAVKSNQSNNEEE